MAQATAAEPNEGPAPSPRRPRRKHRINLCCAQSVQAIVEEVARNLRGLGFRVEVVCGVQARTALLSRAHGDEPTIHVVCVQGSLQERVLKPLRQALAAHGGPNHHLFVAVLDLAVPLAMVGQIRRFAEALERPEPAASSGPDGTAERRSWREHTSGREIDRTVPARVQVVARPGARNPTGPHAGTAVGERTRELTSRGRAVKIGPTSKFRAVTATHGVVPPSESSVMRRRRGERPRLGSGRRRAPREAGAGVGASEGEAPQVATPGGSATIVAASVVPPPVPAPGEMQRRRSSTSLRAAATAPPPPPSPPPSSTPAAEPDRVQPRSASELRFTPPPVKAAESGATRAGWYATVPLAAEGVPRSRADGRRRTTSPEAAAVPPIPTGVEDRTQRYRQQDIDAQVAEVAARSAADDGDTLPAPSRTRPWEPAEGSGPAKTLLQPSRPGGADPIEIAESDKTLLRPDGSFERATTLLREVDTATPGADSSAIPLELARPPIELDPEDVGDPPSGAIEEPRKSTVLYGLGRAVVVPPERRGAEGEWPSGGAEEIVDRPALDVDAKGEPAEGDDEASTRTKIATPERRTAPEEREAERSTPAVVPSSSPRRGAGLWIAFGLLVIVGAGSVGAYRMGLLDGVLGRERGQARTAAAEPAPISDDGAQREPPPKAADDGTPDGSVPAATVATTNPAEAATTDGGDEADDSSGGGEPSIATGGAAAEPEPADAGTSDGTLPEDDTAAPEEPTPAVEPVPAQPEPEPVPAQQPEPVTPKPEPTPTIGEGTKLAPDEVPLAKAADERRLAMLKTLFATKRQGEATTWSAANLRCRKLVVDGVGGWRLPHRREMKLINAVLPLARGIYWTFTVPDDDRNAAYVLDTSTGGLSLFLKQEPTGEVICVRRRAFPER